ncbi:MAG: cell division ATP-binding protein FtsE [Ruminococcaceae bacterium]|nr:cell division ATP-binding protein FtsE [Oscillospiraceae bacterium]
MIEFKNVCKTYKKSKNYVLKNLNLTINDGDFVFIVGHSGAGKTTLTKLLLREEKVSSGTLHIDEFKLEKLRNFRVPYFRRRIGVVFQDFKLLDNKTVFENVAFALQIVGAPKRIIEHRVMEFLALVGLENKRDSFPSQLSGGEKQRVCLARALINKPHIIIADEPTGNLDPELSYDIMNLLVHINDVTHRTVIVVTHEQQLVDHFNKRVVKIEDGEIVSDTAGGQ